MAGKCEAEASSTVVAGGGCIGLRECLEQAAELFGCHADTRIRYLKTNPVTARLWCNDWPPV